MFNSAVQVALHAVRAHTDLNPEIGLILGSGLGELVDLVTDPLIIPTTEIPHYPRATVAGHSGRLVLGHVGKVAVVLVQGRVHLYEGHAPHAITFPVRLLHALGAHRLVVTNAAGGLNPSFHPGTLMFITDQINWTFQTQQVPHLPQNHAILYDERWRAQAETLALRAGIATQRGVYLGLQGPSYETKAEIKAFQRMGADAVGMSTVWEVLQARALGLDVLGLSTITNMGTGLHPVPLTHGEVLAVGQHVKGALMTLLGDILGGLGAT